MPVLINPQGDDGNDRIILRPNRSSSWRANRTFLLGMLGVSLFIGGGFALIGAWMILPFAGLEISALSAALYYVHWKLSYQQVITLEPATLRIDKGVYQPRRRWQLDRENASVAVHPSMYPNDRPMISLVSGRDLVEIGEFLSEDEGQQLLRELRGLGLRIRNHGEPGKRRF